MYEEKYTMALTRWLRNHYLDESIVINEVEEMSGGLSNETVLLSIDTLESASPKQIVLRWNRGEGPMAPYDVHRQYLIMEALQGTGIPIPKTYFFESDTSVIGNEFYGVEYIAEGVLPTIGTSRLLSTNDPVQRQRQLDSFAGTLAQIHALDWNQVGLGFLNVSSLENLIDDKINGLEETYVGTGLDADPVIVAGISWLREHEPPLEEAHLVHGDCTLANYLFNGDDVAAVLDWELASLSDPLEDIGLYLGQIVMEFAKDSPERRLVERRAILEAFARVSDRGYSGLLFWEVFYFVRCLVIFSQFESYYHARTPGRYAAIQRALAAQINFSDENECEASDRA
jgi:aminoglycoside phosphotransferase (APT) family kinase protein